MKPENDINLSTNISRRLKELRKSAGLTQEDIADVLNIATSYYGRVERVEEGARLSLENLIIAADYYGVSLDYLIRGKEGLKNGSELFPDQLIETIRAGDDHLAELVRQYLMLFEKVYKLK